LFFTGNIKITAKGIETPLGVVTLAQIEKGEAILKELYLLFVAGGGKSSQTTRLKMEQLSNEFYTIIPVHSHPPCTFVTNTFSLSLFLSFITYNHSLSYSQVIV
jgi:hypothetical protein